MANVLSNDELDGMPPANAAAWATACLACGELEPASDCTACQSREQQTSRAEPLVGARVWLRREEFPAIVVAVEGDQAALVVDTGNSDSITLPASKDVQLRKLPAIGRSAPEQLIAATCFWTPPEAAQDAIHARVVAACATAPRHIVLRVAAMAHANGITQVLSELEPATETLTWFAVLAKAREQRWEEAVSTSLELPTGRYPARLGIWIQAADNLDAGLVERVVVELGAFEERPDVADIARWLRCELLGTSPAPSLVDDVAFAVRSIDETEFDRRVQRHEAALTSPDILRQHPTMLDEVPQPLLDRLVIDDIIERSWLEGGLSDRVRSRVASWVAPELLPDADLVGQGLWRERIRRALLSGATSPADLADQHRVFAEALFALRDSHDDAFDRVQALDQLDAELLKDLHDFAGGGLAVPSDRMLSDPLVHLAVLRRCIDDLDLSKLVRGRLSQSEQRFVGGIALERARRLLYQQEPDRCVEIAKDCLRLTGDGRRRREALNLIAAANWLQGNDEAAVWALETALDSDPELGLLVNLGVVANECESEAALRHLTRLATEAPILEMRVNAAKRCVELWSRDSRGQESEAELPRELRAALRGLVCLAIDLDSFRDFVRLLAEVDAEWMGRFDRQRAVHRATPEAKLYTAWARSFPDYLTALAALLKVDKDAEWLREQRDKLAAKALAMLLDDDQRPESVGLADAVLKHRVPLTVSAYVSLRTFAAFRVAEQCLEQGQHQEPADRFLEYLEQAEKKFPKLDPDEQEALQPALHGAFETFTRAVLVCRLEQWKYAAEAHDHILSQIAPLPRWQRDGAAIDKAVRELQEVTGSAVERLGRLRRHVDGEVRESLDQLSSAAKQLHDALNKLPHTPRMH